jgi:hypothetical protein
MSTANAAFCVTSRKTWACPKISCSLRWSAIYCVLVCKKLSNRRSVCAKFVELLRSVLKCRTPDNCLHPARRPIAKWKRLMEEVPPESRPDGWRTARKGLQRKVRMALDLAWLWSFCISLPSRAFLRRSLLLRPIRGNPWITGPTPQARI